MELEASVIIIARNAADSIRRQLDALSHQVEAPPFEVLVVDNGSSDRTSAIVHDWIRQGIGAAAHAEVIDASERKGIPYARNCGARAARGKLILWCDADDAVRQGWVAAFTRAFRGNRGAIGGGPTVAWKEGHHDASASTTHLVSSGYLPSVAGANWAVDRRVLLSIGGFDESFPIYGCEEVDVSWRVQEAGYPMVFVPEAVVDYTVTSAPSMAVKKTFRAAMARVALAVRHPDSQAGQPLGLRTLALDALRNTILLPYRMLRPDTRTRARWLRTFVAANGRLVGYWVYGLLKRPAQYISQEHQ